MASQLACNPSYWGPIRGYSLQEVRGAGFGDGADLALFIDLVITASHL
eukprot:CAMPEP_0179362888 /NCGR_PEP_ID=MMETSP0797-20121207/81241_1 /TAXON_ID=47934 /ORGANISM="Dinophysis acuminata, Strain DAEP01" /LENGTH=47 /DNA_ID= /DNA_START= /DNA_END= /DNA_ORIENTATION=